MNTTSSIKIFEQRNSTYSLGDELRFIIPKTVVAVNPLQTYLTCNIEVTSGLQNAFALNEQCGAELLVKQLRILSQDGSAVYEEISDYNKLRRVLSFYANNTTDNNLNQLFQGGQNPAPILLGNNKLFTTTNTGTITQKKLPVQFKLSLSGLLGHSQRPFPNMLSGLQIVILLEDDIHKILRKMGEYTIPRVLPVKGNQSKEDFGAVVGYDTKHAYQVAAYKDKAGNVLIDATNAGNQHVVELHLNTVGVIADNADDNNLIAEGDAYQVQVKQAANTGITQAALPFKVGQKISFFKNGDNGGSTEYEIGSISVSGDLRPILGCNLTTHPDGVDLSAGMENSANNKIISKVAILEPNQEASTTGYQEGSTITISNVEMIVGTINLKPEDQQKIRAAAGSSSGYMLDYQSFVNYPVNITRALVNSVFIPTKLNRTKSILSFYEAVGGSDDLARDNLLPIVDVDTAPKRYNYRINNLIVPNRPVSLENLNKSPTTGGAWSSIHLHELEKALTSSIKVRSLEDSNSCFAVGRQLAVMNHTFDARNASEIRLELDFSRNERDLLIHNFIHHIRRIIISAKGLMVEM